MDKQVNKEYDVMHFWEHQGAADYVAARTQARP